MTRQRLSNLLAMLCLSRFAAPGGARAQSPGISPAFVAEPSGWVEL